MEEDVAKQARKVEESLEQNQMGRKKGQQTKVTPAKQKIKRTKKDPPIIQEPVFIKAESRARKPLEEPHIFWALDLRDPNIARIETEPNKSRGQEGRKTGASAQVPTTWAEKGTETNKAGLCGNAARTHTRGL